MKAFKADHNRSLNEEFHVLIALLCESIPMFKNYDPKKIAVSISRSRSTSKNGVWAYVCPLRFEGGAAMKRASRRGVRGNYLFHSTRIQKLQPQALYLMTFLFPRFFYLSAYERLETIVHELYHLHPELRGDLRIFHGKHKHHGPTPSLFNRRVRELTNDALAQSPWLKSHPLIANQSEYFDSHKSNHIALPRRIFAPEGLTFNNPHLQLLQNFSMLLVFIIALIAGTKVFAQSVTSSRDGVILQSPAGSSERMGSMSSGDKLKFIKSSSSGKWIQVKTSEGVQGWVPANWVKGLPEEEIQKSKSETSTSKPKGAPSQGDDFLDLDELDASDFDEGDAPVSKGKARAKPSSSGGDDFDVEFDESFEESTNKTADGPIEAKGGSSEFADAVETHIGDVGELEKQDRVLDQFFALKKSKFFEAPNKFAMRYGAIEPGDRLHVISKSKSGKWLKIRLLLTGEEGWYPKQWIRVVREDRLERWNPTTLYLGLGWGTARTNFGLGPAIFFNLRSEGFKASPRDRLELGLAFDFFLGEAFDKRENDAADGDIILSINAKYLRFTPLIRYIGVTSNGFMGGSIEGGLHLTRSLVKYSSPDGSTQEELLQILIDSNVRPSATTVGAVVGFSGFVASSPSFQFSAGIRIFFGTPSAAFFHLGPTFRF